ncbi:sorting nexin-17-like [Oscarella lobularis]|uniref:sorting nexin-17-like n=1 Tax=Oscarella lobularis TaxID=121494 RepID=UPI003313D893
MHFSIPYTSEIADETGKFVAFNIHVNGAAHCAVRYSQLAQLNDEIRRQFGSDDLKEFPPKKIKFLKLGAEELEERREKLEKWIQSVSQVQKIVKSSLFQAFFLSAQQEAAQLEAEEVTLDIYLCNGNKETLPVLSTDQSEDILEAFCRKIKLPDKLIYYFGLFLMNVHEDGTEELVRKVQDFESPYISLKDLAGDHRIVLRTWYWDPRYDDDLMENSIAVKLLYVQALHDVELGWFRASKQELKQLSALKAKKSKREYLQLLRSIGHYSFIQMLPCTADFPLANIPGIVSLGPHQLILEVKTKTGETKEFNFQVTRMRCWKVVTCGSRMELSFDYLFSKEKLKWVKIQASQAIFMSVCLQGIVDELLMKRDGTKFKEPSDRVRVTRTLHIKKREVLSTTEMPEMPEIPEMPDTPESSPAAERRENGKSASVAEAEERDDNDDDDDGEKETEETIEGDHMDNDDPESGRRRKERPSRSSSSSERAVSPSHPAQPARKASTGSRSKLKDKAQHLKDKVQSAFHSSTKSSSTDEPKMINLEELTMIQENEVFDKDIGDDDL